MYLILQVGPLGKVGRVGSSVNPRGSCCFGGTEGLLITDLVSFLVSPVDEHIAVGCLCSGTLGDDGAALANAQQQADDDAGGKDGLGLGH